MNNFRINGNIRLYDPYLNINDLVYITKITKTYDAPWEDKVEISNEKDIVISGKNLSSTLSRISSVASSMEQNQALYDRAKAINSSGNIYVERLEGAIDVQKTRLQAAVSSWYTDDNGNIMFVAADGQSAMMLCGEGFMIAPNKNDDGSWNWRTFGTGKGFTADMIITGFLSANVIKAGTITVNKLASDVGESLDLSSNQSVSIVVNNAVDTAIDDLEIGGRNLIHNTLDVENTMMINGLEAGAVNYSEGTIGYAEHGARINAPDESNVKHLPYIQFGSPSTTTLLGLTAGGAYTFSFDVMAKLASVAKTNTKYFLRLVLFHDAETPGTFAIGDYVTIFEYPKSQKGSEKSGRVEWTFTIPSAATKLYFKVYCCTDAGEIIVDSKFGASDYIQMDNIKLEEGDKVTSWSPAPEDFQSAIDRTQDSVADVSADLSQYKTDTAASFVVTNNAINASIETAKTYTDNQLAGVVTDVTTLSAKTGEIEGSVRSLQDGIGTHFVINPGYVSITQDQNDASEMQLYADRMDFVNKNGSVAASFGIDGAYADRLRSNKTLSVGTDGVGGYGWFDFTMMATGMAEKWRSIEGYEQVLRITRQPTDTTGTPDSSTGITHVPLSIDAIGPGTLTYQWQYSADDGTSWQDLGVGANYDMTIGFPRDVVYLYRCKVIVDQSHYLVSDTIHVYCSAAPKVLSESVEVGTNSATLSVMTLGTVSSVKWYVFSQNSWTEISGATSNTLTVSDEGTYVCVVGGNGAYNASRPMIYETA